MPAAGSICGAAATLDNSLVLLETLSSTTYFWQSRCRLQLLGITRIEMLVRVHWPPDATHGSGQSFSGTGALCPCSLGFLKLLESLQTDRSSSASCAARFLIAFVVRPALDRGKILAITCGRRTDTFSDSVHRLTKLLVSAGIPFISEPSPDDAPGQCAVFCSLQLGAHCLEKPGFELKYAPAKR
ncbi:MAG: hypothetical protein JWQ49_895 [Edaphobacter sp.]|nr:hypothetical protein [Edaphobacter sp.]